MDAGTSTRVPEPLGNPISHSNCPRQNNGGVEDRRCGTEGKHQIRIGCRPVVAISTTPAARRRLVRCARFCPGTGGGQSARSVACAAARKAGGGGDIRRV